jgi:uncharacterized protein
MKDSILYTDTRDPLYGYSRGEVFEAIRSCFSSVAEAVYVYGSFARKELHAGSDIDLIVVMKTDLPFVERGRLAECIRDRIPSVEPLVYTPQEFTSLTENPTAGFWESVVTEMVRVV